MKKLKIAGTSHVSGSELAWSTLWGRMWPFVPCTWEWFMPSFRKTRWLMFVPREWEWFGSNSSIWLNGLFHPTQVRMSRIDVVTISHFGVYPTRVGCLSHACGNESLLVELEKIDLMFIPRGWEWFVTVAIRNIKWYGCPTCVGMIRSIWIAFYLRWPFVPRKWEWFKDCCNGDSFVLSFPMHVGVYRKLRISILPFLWGNDSPFAST